MPVIPGRILPALVSLCFSASLAKANSDFAYSASGGEITIHDYLGATTSKIVIPSQIDGSAFSNCGSLA